MPFANTKIIILNDIQRSLNTTSISAELDLLSREISYNGNLSLDTAITSQSEEVLVQAMSIAGKTDPITVDKNFGHRLVAQVFSS